MTRLRRIMTRHRSTSLELPACLPGDGALMHDGKWALSGRQKLARLLGIHDGTGWARQAPELSKAKMRLGGQPEKISS